MHISELSTPCVIVDEDVLKNNVAAMSRVAKQNNVALRPHIKTHKIPQIARMQCDAGACGITAAKVSEAVVMAEHGLDDIFIAYPIIGRDKVEQVIKLTSKIRLTVGVDSLEGARALDEAARKQGARISVRLEIDTGLKRTGCLFEKAPDLAQAVNEMDGLHFDGIYTFKGLTYEGRATLDAKKAAQEEARLMREAKRAIQERGVSVPTVSVGSTPTAANVAEQEGVTEIRPGTYVFYDAMQVAAGTCGLQDCAARILTTVVSVPQAGRLVVDGGSKTFSSDAAPHVPPYQFEGYAHFLQEGLVLERLTEEHGMVRYDPNKRSFKPGERLIAIPNHICTTINLRNEIYLVKNERVIRTYEVKARGMVT